MGSCLKINKHPPSSNLEKQKKISIPEKENAYKSTTPPKQEAQNAPENVAESCFPFRQTNHLNNNMTKNGVGKNGKDDKIDQTNNLNVSLYSQKNGGEKNGKEEEIDEEDSRTLPFNKREKKEVPKLE